MRIEHHPTEEMLGAFAAGTLDHGQHLALATHLVACVECRGFVNSMEAVGGAVITDIAPAKMSPHALAMVQARLERPTASLAMAKPLRIPEHEVPGLPPFVRRYQFGNWQWVAPSVHLRRIELPYASATRVFLLKSAPGTRMLQHTHTGFEMTCILAGVLEQAGSVYGPGDFDFGDPTLNHEPLVETGQDCVCLVAMQGKLQLKGFLGQILQPFIRL